jgi:hypothetical protein|tara:strand:+ start:503 stop:1267 length:765 start_codon:yes stop_codon:yes gene_type:complete
MAKKEKQQVEQTDPIVESVVEENFALQEETLEEGVETSEAVDWEIEAKKFQSMYDKKAAEHENLKRDSDDLIQLKNALSEKPELVDVIEKSLSGESVEGKDMEESTTPDSFDPWDAYYKPDSESYKFRVSNEKKLVHETVDNELGKLRNQMAMNNLKTELVSKHNLGQDDADKFLEFATTPKSNLPIETLIKVWKEREGKGPVVNENLDAVKKAKSIPKAAGVLQGGQQPQASEGDQVWDRIMKSGNRGRLTKQ